MSTLEKPKLRPANDNPWYWLATMYGEYEERPRYSLDLRLAQQNSMAWNRWLASEISDKWREKLIAKGFKASTLTPFSAEEQTEFLKQFAARAGQKDATPPDPRTAISFTDRFDRPVLFIGFVFPRLIIDFNKATFLGYVDFRLATFSGLAYFRGATFSRDANFQEATFSQDAYFEEATFSHNAYFSGASFSGPAYFREAVFSGLASFMGAEFKSHTVFERTKFQISVPDFRDATLREATEWHEAAWPEFRSERLRPQPEDRDAAWQMVYAYERLKAEMERLKKHEDEQFFFAKESRARRVLEPRGSPKWLLNFIYELLGDFGQSIGWPVFWFIVLFALCADFFALAPVYGGAALPYHIAEGLSFTNLSSLLPYKPDKSITDHLSASAKIVGDIQAVLGAVLLFLLGLALRNRFRMK